MKQLSCGIVLKTNKGYLLCHPTGRNEPVFDIPKGCKEENETEWECATRELKEETGLVLTPQNTTYITNLGRHKYIKGKKDLHLFYVEMDEDIQLSQLACTSLIDGSNKPEVDYYVFASDFSQCFPSLQKVLNSIDF